MHPITDERNWLNWLVKVRILILMVLLAIELAVIQLTPSTLPIAPFLVGMALWFALSLFFLGLVSIWHEHRLQALLQVISDLAMVTLVVHVTGGIDSSLNFLYPLVIVVACMLLPGSWAYLCAALAFILFGAILELDYYLVIPSYSTSHPKLKALEVVIFVNLFAYFAIAYLAGLLMSKLRQVDVQLKDASGALENLQALHENIVQSMSGGVITTGLDGRITLVNRAAQHLLEISESELQGQSVAVFFLDPLPHFGTRTAMPKSATPPPTDSARPFACWFPPSMSARAPISASSTLLTISPKFAVWNARFACRIAWLPSDASRPRSPTKSTVSRPRRAAAAGPGSRPVRCRAG